MLLFWQQSGTYLALLQATESHLGAGNVLLGVLEVIKLLLLAVVQHGV
jgi:hypothetical protein